MDFVSLSSAWPRRCVLMVTESSSLASKSCSSNWESMWSDSLGVLVAARSPQQDRALVRLSHSLISLNPTLVTPTPPAHASDAIMKYIPRRIPPMTPATRATEFDVSHQETSSRWRSRNMTILNVSEESVRFSRGSSCPCTARVSSSIAWFHLLDTHAARILEGYPYT